MSYWAHVWTELVIVQWLHWKGGRGWRLSHATGTASCCKRRAVISAACHVARPARSADASLRLNQTVFPIGENTSDTATSCYVLRVWRGSFTMAGWDLVGIVWSSDNFKVYTLHGTSCSRKPIMVLMLWCWCVCGSSSACQHNLVFQQGLICPFNDDAWLHPSNVMWLSSTGNHVLCWIDSNGTLAFQMYIFSCVCLCDRELRDSWVL